MKRSQEEIIARIKAAEDDWLGFRQEVLIDALDFEHAKPFLKPEVTADAWKPALLEEEECLAEAKNYYEFALGKIRDHRGISATRSVQKLTEFAWLLGRDDVVTAMDAANYAQYGAPAVKLWGEAFGMDYPADKPMQRMAESLPCRPGLLRGVRPMTATHTPLPPALRRREQLTALARGQINRPNQNIDADLYALSVLDETATDRWFNELCRAVGRQQGLQWGSLHWSEVLPEATGTDRDGQALDAASVRVELALDALLGEAS